MSANWSGVPQSRCLASGMYCSCPDGQRCHTSQSKPHCPSLQDGCASPVLCTMDGECHYTKSPLGVPPMQSASGKILLEAAGIVDGARNTTHGEKERSFQVIADLWNAYMVGRKVQGPLTPFDVAQFMVLLKIGRSIQGSPNRDHFVDAAGYSAIAGELSNRG